MDKKMNRVVLYKKEGEETPPMPPKKEKKKEPVVHTEPKDEPVDLISWLEDHDLIKIRGLCLEAGVDPGSFHRWMNVTKKIPDDAINKLTPILRKYGYDSIQPNASNG